MSSMHQLPEHVRRIIDREGEVQFTPPSFERWLGRLMMLRTVSSMLAFMGVWLLSWDAGHSMESCTIRGIVAAVVFYFFSWAAGLFLFGELYDAEVKRARRNLEERERERARRIEQYYRERLRALEDDSDASPVPGGSVPSLGDPVSAGPPSWQQNEPQRYAA